MLIDVNAVAQRLAVSRASVWRYAAQNPQFPKPLKLSPGCARWRADEVEAWLTDREIERANAA